MGLHGRTPRPPVAGSGDAHILAALWSLALENESGNCTAVCTDSRTIVGHISDAHTYGLPSTFDAPLAQHTPYNSYL